MSTATGKFNILTCSTQEMQEMLKDMSSFDSDEHKRLLAYFESVKRLAESNSNIEFNNNDSSEAAIFLSFLFAKTQNHLRIFAGDFNGAICGKYLYILSLENAFWKPGKKLTVIFENEPKKKSSGYELLKEIQRKDPENVTLRILTQEYTEKLKQSKKPVAHFTVGDEVMFRYEYDVVNYKSYCNFNDSSLCATLISNFSILLINSNVIVS